MAQWQEPSRLTQPCMVEIGAVSRNWAPHRQLQVLPDCVLPLSCSLFTPRCLHPPLLADNHRAGLSFLHSFPFLPLLALARKELSQLSSCGHPKSEADSKVFCATSPWVSTDLRKWGGEEEGKRVCVIHRGTQTSESESSVEAHQWRKKPDLLSPKNQLQMSAHRFFLCRQLQTLTQRSTVLRLSLPPRIHTCLRKTFLCAQFYTLCFFACIYISTWEHAHPFKLDKIPTPRTNAKTERFWPTWMISQCYL